MKSYIVALVCLLLATGLFSSTTLQAGALGNARPGLRDGSPIAIAAPEPEPAPAKKARNWSAIAAMIAVGAEVLLIALFNVLAATSIGSLILIGGLALSVAVGCFAIIYGLILRRRARGGRNVETTVLGKLSDGTQVLLQRPGDNINPDPELRKKARNTIIWGAIAMVPTLFFALLTALSFRDF